MLGKHEARRLRGPLSGLVLCGPHDAGGKGPGAALQCLSDEALLLSSSCAAFLCDGFELDVCPGRLSSEAQKPGLRAYKRICDQLLPAMRARSHLFNIIFRNKDTITFVLKHASSQQAVGGVTFRMLRSNRGVVVADVLVLAVQQQAGITGRGHGTCLINAVKFLAGSLQVRQLSCVVLSSSLAGRHPAPVLLGRRGRAGLWVAVCGWRFVGGCPPATSADGR